MNARQVGNAGQGKKPGDDGFAAHFGFRVREAVRQFTPNWFTVTMGTGVLALAINQFPVAFAGQHAVAITLWAVDIALFTLFALAYAARWIFFFDGARRIFGHSVVSMFFGAIPMGLATILNGGLAFGIPLWGEATVVPVVHALWYVDVAMALASGLLIPYLMFTRQDHAIDRMTAVWLLPVVACEVAAVTGAQLVPHLAPDAAFSTLILGYVLWALSVPVAMSILVILILRLALHKLPSRDMAASGWLALGPIGTGALGLLLLGGDARPVFTAAGLGPVGDVAFGLGLIGGLMLWGYGVWWLGMAMLKTVRYIREGMPFNIGWWGFTFPLGVYSLSTLALGRVTGLDIFAAIGAALILLLAGFWVVVAVRTLHGAWKGYLFVSPCLLTQPAARKLEADFV